MVQHPHFSQSELHFEIFFSTDIFPSERVQHPRFLRNWDRQPKHWQSKGCTPTLFLVKGFKHPHFFKRKVLTVTLLLMILVIVEHPHFPSGWEQPILLSTQVFHTHTFNEVLYCPILPANKRQVHIKYFVSPHGESGGGTVFPLLASLPRPLPQAERQEDKCGTHTKKIK